MSDIPEFLDAKEIACAFGISLATVKRYANEPDFPDPFEWSAGKVKWLKTEVVEWFLSRRRKSAA